MYKRCLLPKPGRRPSLLVRLAVPELRYLIPPWDLLRLVGSPLLLLLLQLLLLGGQIRYSLRSYLLLNRDQLSHLCLDAIAELLCSVPQVYVCRCNNGIINPLDLFFFV
jgi:hypothetical protein